MKNTNTTDINNMTLAELSLILSCRLLAITKHSADFVEGQKKLISKMELSKTAKQACLDSLNSIEIEG